jgi:hypothetical protein
MIAFSSERSLRSRCLSLRKRSQFFLGNDEFPEATIAADDELREYEHGGFVDILEPAKMNREFTIETAQVFGAA